AAIEQIRGGGPDETQNPDCGDPACVWRVGTRRDAALGGAERHPDARSAFAEPCDDDLDHAALLRAAGALRQEVPDRARARRELGAGEPGAVALQAAPERQVPRRLAVYRGRCDLLVRAHQAAAGHDAALR